MLVSVEIRQAEIASLVRRGLLATGQQNSAYEVGEALVRLIESELGAAHER